MRRAVLIVVVVLGSAIGCTDNPVSPSAVPVRADAFRNSSVYRPESGQPCAPFFYYSSCACWVPCDQVPPPPHRRSMRH